MSKVKQLLVLAPLLGAGCAQNDQQACASFGFQPGTNAFANCMMERDSQRRQALMTYMQMQAARPQPPMAVVQPVQPYQIPTTRTTYTNCNSVGNLVFCNSTTPQ